MLLHLHSSTVGRLAADRHIKYLVRDYFCLPRSIALMPAMLERGLGQADLVLCLLRLRDAHATLRRSLEDHIAQLIGHPICVGPACLRSYRTGPTRVVRSQDDRRITWVVPDNPRQHGTEAHLRWCEYRIGRTLGQLYVRGVTKRDVRRALRRGWIKLEEVCDAVEA